MNAPSVAVSCEFPGLLPFAAVSVYLHDSVGVTAQCYLDLLQEIAAEMSLVSGVWILGGDWNCTPDELAATGWLQLVVMHPQKSGPGSGTLIPHLFTIGNISGWYQRLKITIKDHRSAKYS